MIAAVVPVKALALSKSRLLPELPREAVARLALAMMADVVAALCAVPRIARVAVVTPDPALARAAEELGAEALLRDDPGLNEAVETAAALLAPGPDDGVLVVLGDVAGAQPADLERLLDALGGAPGVALAPSRDGGTSALLRVPRDAIPARFGPASASRHRDEARRAGVRYRQLALPSLAVDVDVAEDVEALLRGAGAPHTRAALAALRAEASR